MWLDNLKEIKAEKKMSTKQIADRAGLPEKTVTRVLSGRTSSPYLDTLDRIAMALGVTIGDILAGTKAVISDSTVPDLQITIDEITRERDAVIAERDLLLAENEILKKKVDALSAETELLKTQLLHKEELLAVHSFYMAKMKQ